MLHWLYRLADAARHRARQRRWSADQASGRRGEDLAHRFLQRAGLRVVARNYRTPSGSGEIDLIAWERETLAFVEVKSRVTAEHGAPERNVDPDKQRHMRRAALDYTRRAGVAWEQVRFDVLAVLLTDPPVVSYYRNAFRAGTAITSHTSEGDSRAL